MLKSDGLEEANKYLKKLIKDYCYKYNITWLKNYSNVDKDGNIYFPVDLSTPGKPRSVNIESINLKLDPLPTRGWSSDKRFIDLYNQNRLCFKDGRPYAKHYLYEAEDNVTSLLRYFSRQGTNDLKKLGLSNLFDTPKPVEMLKFLIRISTEENDRVMDFFAGSGTLGQAVYEINEEDGKHLEYTLIQIPEKVQEKSMVYQTCKNFNIIPSVDNILRFRLERYLQLNGKEIDFNCYEIN